MNCIADILKTACGTQPHWDYIPAFDPDMEEFSGIRAVTYDGL